METTKIAATIAADSNDAIRTLLATGKELVGAAPRIHNLTVTENGAEVEYPIAVIQTGPEKYEVRSLVALQKEAIELARAERRRTADGPDRRCGTATLQSVDSLIAHANRFKDDNSAIWADAASRRAVAVLNYNRIGATGTSRWGDHRGIYEFPLSDAWKAWGGEQGLQLDQETLAELLDKRDREISEGAMAGGIQAPSAAWMLSMAENLETYTNAKAKRERDPSGRLKISFSNESGFVGDVMPPRAFLIKIPVFRDSAPQPIEVRLRAAVDDGAASFELFMAGASDILRDAFNTLVSLVGEKTKLPVFIGTPEQ
jgi:uncharacterized protein YfdQ (DUF2303 family)